MKFLAVTLSAIAIWMGGHAVMQRAPVQVVDVANIPCPCFCGCGKSPCLCPECYCDDALLETKLALPPSSQVVIYVGDPVAAWADMSDCGPCNRICRDLKKHYKTDDGKYIVWTGNESFFRLVKAPAGTATPTIVFPGKRSIVGYLGDHAELVRKHPLAGRIKKR